MTITVIDGEPIYRTSLGDRQVIYSTEAPDTGMHAIMTAVAGRRRHLGIRQVDMADRMAVSAATLRAWETGRRTPTLLDAQRYARALGLQLLLTFPDVKRGESNAD
jgi:DNA-binding XRE family transcriptional regulator